MTDEPETLPPDTGQLPPGTASGWLEASADPVGSGGWQPPRGTGEERPRRSASAEAAALRFLEFEQ